MKNAEIIKISNGYYVVRKYYEQTFDRQWFKNKKAAEICKLQWETV